MATHDLSHYTDLSHIAAFPTKVNARCDACGCAWEYHRHDALTCPMCSASFTIAYMSPVAPSFVDFEGTGGATNA